ncbi:acetyltransferase [Mycobacterium sp. M1]|uniref:Lysine N-acyltransferase MbtK n=1 Tax=Mycolicibacter acidiphilus TaxID=2835306 RepID=A0ABS5RM31_9MYCO|nr:GNAT family N-acetyltransferase [Mycolicibacter acidiphilus]MBS9534546.1 acetyltransferase [Mycolicibacter acidiphilus]
MDTQDLQERRLTLDLPGLSGAFTLRALDIAQDLDLLHAWMNDPEVAQFWHKAWPRDQIEAYLREQQDTTHSTPYVGALNEVPISYWELYRADLDPLAQHYAARPHDAGVHFLVGPAECRGRRLAADLLRAVAGWQLDADPLATRVVGEPDAGNERLIKTAELAGFHRAGILELPHKRAALLIRDRE